MNPRKPEAHIGGRGEEVLRLGSSGRKNCPVKNTEGQGSEENVQLRGLQG